jgi:antitoxin VapB
MALNIKDRATEDIVRRLAERTGLTITEAIRQAATDKLRQMDDDYRERIAQLTPEQRAKLRRLEEISRRGASRPLLDGRTEDEILGFNAKGTFD